MLKSKSTVRHISNSKIAKRQKFALRLGEKICELVSDTTELREILNLFLWHGSLVRGKGGKKYDVDYAIFLSTDSPQQLVNRATFLALQVAEHFQEISWRADLHYDGMTMFEAHTHWDITKEAFSDTHIGVHFYREIALQEIFGDFDWRVENRPNSTFFRLFESWRRFCFFYRHWIYEGVALYDPNSVCEKAGKLSWLPPKWMLDELYEVALCILSGYTSSRNGICTVSESKQLALDIIAALAYTSACIPMGHHMRYESDLQEFKDMRAKSLLRAVAKDNLVLAAKELNNVIRGKQEKEERK